MARPQKCRKICNPPKMKGFKPFGMPLCKVDHVTLSFEEYECIKLLNYDMLMQDKAAELMDISRPTLTRIYNKALKTLAIAFVEGKAIEIRGGNFQFEKEWYRCNNCHRLIEGIENHIQCKGCKLFGKEELIKLNENQLTAEN